MSKHLEETYKQLNKMIYVRCDIFFTDKLRFLVLGEKHGWKNQNEVF